MAFDENELKKGKKLVTKVWNASRLVLLNIEDFDYDEKYDLETLDWIDKRIIQESINVAEKMSKHLDAYNVGIALIEFEKFFWSTFCDDYLEITK